MTLVLEAAVLCMDIGNLILENKRLMLNFVAQWHQIRILAEKAYSLTSSSEIWHISFQEKDEYLAWRHKD